MPLLLTRRYPPGRYYYPPQVPGPGNYAHYSQLRGKGAPKFGTGTVPSFIEQVMNDSKKKPGPGGSLFVTPTFKEEQERRKYMKSIVGGD